MIFSKVSKMLNELSKVITGKVNYNDDIYCSYCRQLQKIEQQFPYKCLNFKKSAFS